MAEDTERVKGRLSPGGMQALGAMMAAIGEWSRGVGATGPAGDRDYPQILGYPVDPSFEDYLYFYERWELGQPIITAFPKSTWRNAPVVRFVADAETPEDVQEQFLTEYNALARRVRLYPKLRKADIRSGIGRYAAVVLGFRDGGDWSQPVEKNKGGELVYLSVYDEPQAVVANLVEDINDPRYHLPEYYDIFTGEDSMSTHWSRVLHVLEDPDDEVYGTPRLESVFNAMLVLVKTVHGSGEAIWHDVVGTFHADVREGYELTAEDEEALTEAIDLFLNNMRRVVQTRGIDLTKIPGNIVDPTGIFEVVLQLISASKGIPRTILTGSDRGDVSKAAEERQWAGEIADRQKNFAVPLLMDFIERLVFAGILPEVRTDELEFVWPPLFEQTAQEKAEVGRTLIGAVVDMAGALGLSPDVFVEFDELRGWLGLDGRPSDEKAVEEYGKLAMQLRLVRELMQAGASPTGVARLVGMTPEQARLIEAWGLTDVE